MSEKKRLVLRRDTILAMHPIRRWLNKYELTSINNQLHLIAVAEKMGHDLVYRHRLHVPFRGDPQFTIVLHSIVEMGEEKVRISGIVSKKEFKLMRDEGIIQRFVCFDD